MIHIVVPTEGEIAPLARLIEGASLAEIGRRRGISGTISGRPVTAVVSGVGQANTAQALTALFEGGTPRLAIMGGCAGAYQGLDIAVGDTAVATEEIYADLGVITRYGWKSIEEIGLPLLELDGKRLYERFPLAMEHKNALEEAAREAGFSPRPGGSPRVHFGHFLTISTISGAAERGDALYMRFKGICENMEGAAAAQVSALYGVPFVEVRGISNMVEDRDRNKWDIPAASKAGAAVIGKFIEKL